MNAVSVILFKLCEMHRDKELHYNCKSWKHAINDYADSTVRRISVRCEKILTGEMGGDMVFMARRYEEIKAYADRVLVARAEEVLLGEE